MSETELEAEDIERKVHDLASAMKKVKTAQADRDDVVVEMKHAKVSRLELLAEELEPVFAALPDNSEMFEFALAKGETPRLWIDMTSFVRMGKDGRVFEFVKDTRMGRTILGSTKNREKIGTHITDYVAERLLERERMIEGEWVSARSTSDEADTVQETSEAETDQTTDTPEVIEDKTPEKKNRGYSLLSTLVWFVIGLAIGLGVLMFAMVFDQFEPLRQWLAGLGA